jgi:putative colanic acid biosynthesis acetyltransferase WcaF
VQGIEHLDIDDGAVIGWRCHLDGRGGLRIGRNVTLGPDVYLLTADHDPSDPAFGQRNSPIAVGDRAWLASRCTVLRGTTIGQGAVVAAGAVVTRDVPEFHIVGGIPAEHIGDRSRDLDYERTFRPLLY